jgi:putative ABC transport system permease protein
MNIRVALGASVSGVFALVLRQTAVPLAAGVVAGFAGALAAGRIVAGLLFQVRPRDPIVVALAIVLVGGAGVLATTIATRQSLRINPVEALREE